MFSKMYVDKHFWFYVKILSENILNKIIIFKVSIENNVGDQMFRNGGNNE
jgi:hypothetical protein